jgi:glutathione-regulated potassium-efflux system ancillary protein KefG
MRILVLFAHPAFEVSRVNRRLAHAIATMPGITFHDLYEAYPDFDVDVRREQQLLVAHDLVVAQHPFFWYSTPALVKQWEDLVLEHGWAYGTGGTALEGKLWLSVITAGGRETAYRHGGHNRFTIRELLAPIEQTVRLCRMRFLPPFVVHGTHLMTEAEMDRHAADYRRLLDGLRDDRVDLSSVDDLPRLNHDLERVLR